jgi:hypothetical protein
MPSLSPPSRPLRSGLALVVAVAALLVAPAARPADPPDAPGAVAAPPAEAAPAKKEKRPAFKLPAAIRRPAEAPALAVAPVDPLARPAVRAAAGRIDALLAARHAAAGVAPGAPLTDEQFVRRVFLDLGGRIPTHDETVAFLESTDPEKRDGLVERILAGPDWVSRFYDLWADTLRLAERPQRDVWSEPYLDWVKRSIAANRPYDAWVREMLTADGKMWENPAVGFQLRDEGMPLPYVDNTVRVFLGTQIGCAQCHDHPFESWTQHQFYELAAFTSGLRTGAPARPAKGKAKAEERTPDGIEKASRNARALVVETRKRAEKEGKRVDNQFVQYLQANGVTVNFLERPLKLPSDYRADDASPGDTVAPAVPWGEIPAEARDLDGRARFAAWVTARDNRQFSRTIANRLWKMLFGVGIVEPIDDFREGNPPSDPELLDHLADEIVRLDFDLREFVRVVVSTDAWRRRAIPHDDSSETPYAFAAPALRRLSAEQLWDSLLTLVARDPQAYQRPTYEEFATAVNLDLSGKKPDLDTAREAYDAYAGSQAPRALRKRSLDRFGYQGLVLARASELPTPLPLGHFLRQFGQSDRETIDGGRTVATVPQILAMFNGPITHAMLERGSAIAEQIADKPPGEAVDTIFLTILSRRPDAEDRSLSIEAIEAAEDAATGHGNVIWALLNTREFLFVQ